MYWCHWKEGTRKKTQVEGGERASVRREIFSTPYVQELGIWEKRERKWLLWRRICLFLVGLLLSFFPFLSRISQTDWRVNSEWYIYGKQLLSYRLRAHLFMRASGWICWGREDQSTGEIETFLYIRKKKNIKRRRIVASSRYASEVEPKNKVSEQSLWRRRLRLM